MTVNAFKKVLAFLPTAVRLLIGFLLITNGWVWLHRPDPGQYLTKALIGNMPFSVPLYRPFLEVIVLPNVGVFAALVSWGEFLSGISLFFGAAGRLGAAVIAFQFLNYGLMGGWYISVLAHGVLMLLVAATVYWESGRAFGVDRWLHRRWPRALIW